MNTGLVYNDGTPITLSPREIKTARYWEQHIDNALGYEVQITTLTAIQKKISEQKFFKLAPADYMPVQVGEGAFSSNLEFYRSYGIADSFVTGLVNIGANNNRQATADAAIDAVNLKVFDWTKMTGWSVIELQKAARSGNWDLVAQKERARKENWDLGIQAIAFLGIDGNSSCLGLLNQSGVTVNLTRITQSISSLSSDALSAFIGGILNDYRVNCNRTAWPSHFTIPESDFLGLATPTSNDFPIKSRLQLMQETFATMTGKPDFKILPCAYADSISHPNSTAGLNIVGQQVYALYNYEETSYRMSIPVDYTTTLANSLDNFNFQNSAYGEFTGGAMLRPAEMLYFQYTF